MAGDWENLTDEQLVRGFMETYGLDRPGAERQVALARGTLVLHPFEQPSRVTETVEPADWARQHR